MFAWMRPSDTSAAAASVQEEILARFGPERRFEVAMQLSELAMEFARAGLRQRRPDLGEKEINRELARLLHMR
jgi:hypothetical protein